MARGFTVVTRRRTVRVNILIENDVLFLLLRVVEFVIKRMGSRPRSVPVGTGSGVRIFDNYC